MRRDRIEQIISEFPKRPIIVLGDFMIDEYIFGSVERISPEAPVPVVEQKRVERIPGGAGNVVAKEPGGRITVFPFSLWLSIIRKLDPGMQTAAMVDPPGLRRQKKPWPDPAEKDNPKIRMRAARIWRS